MAVSTSPGLKTHRREAQSTAVSGVSTVAFQLTVTRRQFPPAPPEPSPRGPGGGGRRRRGCGSAGDPSSSAGGAGPRRRRRGARRARLSGRRERRRALLAAVAVVAVADLRPHPGRGAGPCSLRNWFPEPRERSTRCPGTDDHQRRLGVRHDPGRADQGGEAKDSPSSAARLRDGLDAGPSRPRCATSSPARSRPSPAAGCRRLPQRQPPRPRSRARGDAARARPPLGRTRSAVTSVNRTTRMNTTVSSRRSTGTSWRSQHGHCKRIHRRTPPVTFAARRVSWKH